jgi:hypothetical protein
MTDSLLGELLLLRRAGTVDDYTDQFLTLTCSDADLSDRQLVQIYTAGLTNPLKTDVALRRPATLDDAIKLARAYEHRMQLESTPGCGVRSAHLPSPGAATTKVAAPSQAVGSASSAVPGLGKTAPLSSTLLHRRLSQAEMVQRRADRLCYNCDEKFVVGHRCKKLFILEFTESDDEEAVDEEIECSALTATYDSLGISLHAITVTGVRARGV